MILTEGIFRLNYNLTFNTKNIPLKSGCGKMKVAIIGSRGLWVNDLEKVLPENVDEIVSGGAIGIDTCARNYATQNNLKLTEFLPEYDKYGKGAPLKRNLQIIDYADLVIAFWDGESHGTEFVINNCKKIKKPIKIYKKKTQQ